MDRMPRERTAPSLSENIRGRNWLFADGLQRYINGCVGELVATAVPAENGLKIRAGYHEYLLTEDGNLQDRSDTGKNPEADSAIKTMIEGFCSKNGIRIDREIITDTAEKTTDRDIFRELFPPKKEPGGQAVDFMDDRPIEIRRPSVELESENETAERRKVLDREFVKEGYDTYLTDGWMPVPPADNDRWR